MMPRHHPHDETLLAYGAGTLGAGLSLVVASHLSFCADCAAAVTDAQAFGGILLDELPPMALDADALDRALARIGAVLPAGPRDLRAAADPLLPEPLALRLGSAPRWHILAPGMSQCEVLPRHEAGGGIVRMLRIAKGKKLPRHGHTGTELTLVLKGAYADETGSFARGDLAEMDDDTAHEPVAAHGEECICVIATEGPLKFESGLARMFQRFTGF